MIVTERLVSWELCVACHVNVTITANQRPSFGHVTNEKTLSVKIVTIISIMNET